MGERLTGSQKVMGSSPTVSISLHTAVKSWKFQHSKNLWLYFTWFVFHKAGFFFISEMTGGGLWGKFSNFGELKECGIPGAVSFREHIEKLGGKGT